MRLRALGWLLAAGLACQAGLAAERADFLGAPASSEARYVADWAVRSGDHHGMPFVIVDKLNSRVFVFDRQARLLGTALALLGLAPGDAGVAGIGARALSTIRPDERTTPAGRFVASLDRNEHGDEILWVDYDAAIALHRVAVGVPRERRLERLTSLVPSDHRITYGCINVPVRFFLDVVAPAFRGSDGIVYVLPETRPAREVFGAGQAVPPVPSGL
ncbi:hypothetical protein LZ009_19510 [Ramlibacter sp. XY19]|uniref:hypothetical protein n=1 Tax=Ramlibacter paludis TaxID=2908000 RepID=UPI0023D98632|nr:hypothetical protein [Ramlibacter paludis]MCG2594972.1 hypothetical protein [Ramlibacter paludis]